MDGEKKVSYTKTGLKPLTDDDIAPNQRNKYRGAKNARDLYFGTSTRNRDSEDTSSSKDARNNSAFRVDNPVPEATIDDKITQLLDMIKQLQVDVHKIDTETQLSFRQVATAMDGLSSRLSELESNNDPSGENVSMGVDVVPDSM